MVLFKELYMKNELKKYLVIMTATISILVAGSFISCGDDDDEVDVPIVANPQVDNMLNSAEVTDFNCVSATLKGTMVSKQDLQRFYPKRFVMLSIMYMDADESIQMENVDDTFFQKTQIISDWDDHQYVFELGYLKPATRYLYKVCLQVDSVYFTGRVKSFTTEGVDKYLWMDVIERNFTSVKLAGKGHVEHMIGKSNIYVNFDEEWPSQFVPATQTGDSLTATIEGLWPGCTYTYWVTASGVHGTLDTSKRTFTTSSPADYIYIDTPVQVTSSSVVISGSLDPKIFAKNNGISINILLGTDKEHLEYDITSGGLIQDYHFSKTINGLKPATTYYFRVGTLWFHGDSYADEFYTEPLSFTTTE